MWPPHNSSRLLLMLHLKNASRQHPVLDSGDGTAQSGKNEEQVISLPTAAHMHPKILSGRWNDSIVQH